MRVTPGGLGEDVDGTLRVGSGGGFGRQGGWWAGRGSSHVHVRAEQRWAQALPLRRHGNGCPHLPGCHGSVARVLFVLTCPS